MIFNLTPSEIDRCLTFAKDSAPTQQDIEFGDHTTAKRSISEIVNDTVKGKVGELAFQKFLNTYGIYSEVDFNIYERGVWDEQDFIINGWRIDVKATQPKSNWLLVEWNKLKFRRKDDNSSHVYTISSVNLYDKNTCEINIRGFAFLEQLTGDSPNTNIVRRGSFLPDGKCKLQADNYAIHFDHLHQNWDKLISIMNKNANNNNNLYDLYKG